MKQHLKNFAIRGLLAASGGPIILAIIYGILGTTGEVTSLTPDEVCMGILTVTLMAFIAAGITVVYQIDRLPLLSAILIHGTALYLDYILIYLLNGWLKSQIVPILVFTAIFAVGYALIWLIIYLSIRSKTNAMNQKLQESRT